MAYEVLFVLISAGVAALSLILLFHYRKKRDRALKPAIDRLAAILPNANCGACGTPGCRDLAKKILTGKAPPDACVSGGGITAVMVARHLGCQDEDYRNRY